MIHSRLGNISELNGKDEMELSVRKALFILVFGSCESDIKIYLHYSVVSLRSIKLTFYFYFLKVYLMMRGTIYFTMTFR